MIKNLHNSIRHKASVSKNYMQMKTLKKEKLEAPEASRLERKQSIHAKIKRMNTLRARVDQSTS